MPGQLDEVNFFVYGTLKRGECRQYAWPRQPLDVEEAWVHGELYDAGSYPALFPGSDRVLGELWSFALKDFETIAKTLDDIEEYLPGDPFNLYNREIVACETLTGRRAAAHIYIYARTQDLPTFNRLLPTSIASYAQWRSR